MVSLASQLAACAQWNEDRAKHPPEKSTAKDIARWRRQAKTLWAEVYALDNPPDPLVDGVKEVA